MKLLAPLVLMLLAGPASEGVERVGHFDDPRLGEVSGICLSRAARQVAWVHNDSGNPPALFAVRLDGSLVRSYRVGVPNLDWEDIASDGAGHLYLGDTGNNGLHLPIRAIHRLDEPDLEAPPAELLPVKHSIYYKFGPEGRFDAEGLVIDGDTALLVAKYLDGREPDLFAVPIDRAAPWTRPVVPKRVGVLPGFREPATGASLSTDGRRLAVCSLAVARVYERDLRGSPWRPVGEVRYRADGIEAIAWDGPNLILTGEGRGIYRVPEAAWRAGRPVH